MQERTKTWVQCQTCGLVYEIPESIHFDILYVTTYCPKCKEYSNVLNLGPEEDDIDLMKNYIFDERYY